MPVKELDDEDAPQNIVSGTEIMEDSKKFFFVTPQIDSTSSVFLTLPFSDEASSSKTIALREMDVLCFPLIKNLVLSPTTPVKPR